MNPYIKKILPHLMTGNCNSAILRQQMYNVYRELHPQDSEAIREAFAQLDTLLNKLPLRKYDQVWDLACKLCCESEQEAFLEGLRVGIQLSFGVPRT